MDYTLAHALDRFTATHDGFEDALSAGMGWSEWFFAAVLVVLFLGVRGGLRGTAQRAAVAAAASFGLAALLAHVIGLLVDRSRPFVEHPHTIHAFLPHVADASFPSDHATAAFAIATAVALRRAPWGVVLLAIAAVVAAGRVFLGLHYPSDVLVGALVGSACAGLLFIAPLRRRLDRLSDFAAGLTDRLIALVLGRRLDRPVRG